jgi:hypothetical protein
MMVEMSLKPYYVLDPALFEKVKWSWLHMKHQVLISLVFLSRKAPSEKHHVALKNVGVYAFILRCLIQACTFPLTLAVSQRAVS